MKVALWIFIITCKNRGAVYIQIFVMCNELPCYPETSNSVANVISYTFIAAGMFVCGYEFQIGR